MKKLALLGLGREARAVRMWIFAVTPGSSSSPAAPTIGSFSPTSGPVGTSVTVTGSGFTGATEVTFAGTSAALTVGSDTSLTATAPAGAGARFDRRHHSGRNRTSSASFDVTTATAAPTISSFSPTSGPAGTLVRIAGTGFTGTTRVTFGGASAAFTVVSDTAVTATVPAAAETGPIAVTASGGTAASSRSFRVTKH